MWREDGCEKNLAPWEEEKPSPMRGEMSEIEEREI